MRLRGGWVVFVFAITCLLPFLYGETGERSHSKKSQCMERINGPSLGFNAWSCGTQGYTRVFTGTVRSAVDVSDTEKRLELIPDEVFLGNTSELTATVNQECLAENQPEIQAGDQWLFYVRPKRYWDRETMCSRTPSY